MIPTWFNNKIDQWLQEDIPTFDYVGKVVGTANKQAKLYVKQTTIIAGVEFFDMVMARVGCAVEWNYSEGDFIQYQGERIVAATITGPGNRILQAERIGLNLLAQCSSIAYQSSLLVQLKGSWTGAIAATRKTTPGFGMIQKYGAIVGGCDSHRMNLSDMVMIKDNCIDSCGSVCSAVESVRSVCGFSHKIEVEARTYDEAIEALDAGADIIMLDNMKPEAAIETASRLKWKNGSVLIEVSGGITPETIKSYMHPAIDIISSSKILFSPPTDMSLKIVRSL